MRAKVSKDAVRDAMIKSGTSWIFECWGEDLDRNLGKTRRDIENFAREYQKRFHERPDPFELLQINPTKGTAFFQVISFSTSVEMKILVWRILMGWEVHKIRFSYEPNKDSFLSVTLKSPAGEIDPPYEGQKYTDFRVLQHLGVAAKDEKLILDGFYA